MTRERADGIGVIVKRLIQSLSLAALLLGGYLAWVPQANAAEDFASLSAQIEAANSGRGSHIITLSRDITLDAALPPIRGEIAIRRQWAQPKRRRTISHL